MSLPGAGTSRRVREKQFNLVLVAIFDQWIKAPPQSTPPFPPLPPCFKVFSDYRPISAIFPLFTVSRRPW